MIQLPTSLARPSHEIEIKQDGGGFFVQSTTISMFMSYQAAWNFVEHQCQIWGMPLKSVKNYTKYAKKGKNRSAKNLPQKHIYQVKKETSLMRRR